MNKLNITKLILPFTTDNYILGYKNSIKQLLKHKNFTQKEIDVLNTLLENKHLLSSRKIKLLKDMIEVRELTIKKFNKDIKEFGDNIQRMRNNLFKKHQSDIIKYKQNMMFIKSSATDDKLIIETNQIINNINTDKKYHLETYREKYGLSIFGYDASEFN